jgi:hypothetical protein
LRTCPFSCIEDADCPGECAFCQDNGFCGTLDTCVSTTTTTSTTQAPTTTSTTSPLCTLEGALPSSNVTVEAGCTFIPPCCDDLTCVTVRDNTGAILAEVCLDLPADHCILDPCEEGFCNILTGECDETPTTTTLDPSTTTTGEPPTTTTPACTPEGVLPSANVTVEIGCQTIALCCSGLTCVTVSDTSGTVIAEICLDSSHCLIAGCDAGVCDPLNGDCEVGITTTAPTTLGAGQSSTLVQDCVPASCSDLGLICGGAGDGCGGWLDCGPCSEPVSVQPDVCSGEGERCVDDGQCCAGLCRGRGCRDRGTKTCQAACTA